jgi:molybdenum cofactor cytidylyltransferase
MPSANGDTGPAETGTCRAKSVTAPKRQAMERAEMNIALLLLAAGNSRRMRGADKLLQPVGAMPCLRAMARRGLQAGAEVFVTLPMDRPERNAALDGLDVTRIAVPDAAMGMAHSLRAGVFALPARAAAVMVLPADMPDITSADMKAMMTGFIAGPAALILRASTEDGKPGHPIIFDRDLFGDFATLTGDSGAARLVRKNQHQMRLFRLAGQRARCDLDTPADWAAWQKTRQGNSS